MQARRAIERHPSPVTLCFVATTKLASERHTGGGSRIFPRGVRQLPKVLLFFKFFAKNRMKMKEFGPRGARPWRPLRSANAHYNEVDPSVIFYDN